VIFIEGSSYNKGDGYFLIAGARFTMPTDWVPTISAALQNVLDSPLRAYGAWPAEPYKQNLTVGISISPMLGSTTRLHLEVDSHDLPALFGTTFDADALQIGAELDFNRRFFIRGGYFNQYPSFGLGYIAPNFSLSFSTYAVLTDVGNNQYKTERRVNFSLSFGF
jgi:hypothetical protein